MGNDDMFYRRENVMGDDMFYRSVSLMAWNKEIKYESTVSYQYEIVKTVTLNILKIRLIGDKMITVTCKETVGKDAPWKDFYTWYMEKESPSYIFDHAKPLRVYRKDILLCNHFTKTKKIK